MKLVSRHDSAKESGGRAKPIQCMETCIGTFVKKFANAGFEGTSANLTVPCLNTVV